MDSATVKYGRCRQGVDEDYSESRHYSADTHEAPRQT